MNQKIIFLLLIFIILTNTRKHLNKNDKAEQQKRTVVESNHFYSNYELGTNYQINSIKKDKSLIFLLKQNPNKDALSLKQNPLTVTLKSTDDKQVCDFKTMNNMCALKNTDGNNMNLSFQCKKTPCQLSWMIIQPSVFTKQGEHKIQQLVYLSQTHHHSSLIVICNDPNVKNFGSNLQLYTNSDYEKIQNDRAVYYLFQEQQKGYYYITSPIDAVKGCANVSLKHTSQNVTFNTKNQQYMSDFIKVGKSNTYQIDKIPQTDFRLDAFFHPAKSIKLDSTSNLQLTLFGLKNGQRSKIQTNVVPAGQKYAVDFNIIFKKPEKQYKKLSLQVKNNGKQVIILSMNFRAQQRQQVSVGQISFFSLKKGQMINFQLVPLTEQTSEDKNASIKSSNQTKFKTTLNQCKIKVGCQFTLQALEDGDGNINISDTSPFNPANFITFDFNDTITHKIREGEKILLHKSVKGKNYFQGIINTPNVLIYVSNKAKCDVPSSECHEKVLNFHNPIIYQPKGDDEIFFLVQGLQNCVFTLSTLSENQEYIKVQDTKPFAYLFDDGEKQLIFKFSLTKKQDVSFNLIAPVNELILSVSNGDTIQQGQGQISSDGYISFKEQDITSLNFVIKVQKRQQYNNKFIHFTLLVSTHEGNVRLEPSVAHYETIGVDESRDYVFEFEPKKDILINFYTHNLRDNINIEAALSKTDEYVDSSDIINFVIDSQSDILELKDAAEGLCGQKSQNCELYLRLKNKMEAEIDVTLTLMMKESIIQLKDGIWSSYKTSQITKNTHFYFLPKHVNKTVAIVYSSDSVDIKIMYSIWKTDDKMINPALWPFPEHYKESAGSKSPLLSYRPTKLIHIDSVLLKKCWPNCVVLVSIFEDQSVTGRYNSFLQSQTFKIMASNNYIEVPQKRKIDMALKKDEVKHFLVDLKYVLEKKAVTFFTYFTIGSVILKGNTYDDENPRCPTQDEMGDFRFGNLETQISINTIKDKLKQNGMTEDQHPYICIMAKATSDSKFSIEYNSDEDMITNIVLDSFYTHKLQSGAVLYLQADATQEFKLKISRTEGYPYIDTQVCKSDDDFEDCFDKFKSETEKGLQLVDKMTTVSQQPCQKCILFIKVTSTDPSNIDVHCQSKYSETELIQGKIVTDEVVKTDQNKYLITSLKDEEVIINIQITHGDLQAFLTDFGSIKVNKTSKKGENHIHISVPPPKKEKKDNSDFDSIWGKTFFSSFAQSIFNSLHLTIKSNDPKTKAVYTVSYSSGQYEVYLQDGLITGYGLMPLKETKFLYNNPTLSKIYLHISSHNATFLNELKINILALSDPNDQQSGVSLTPEKVKFNKKTPDPTMIIALPANKLFQIKINNHLKQFQLIDISVNNQQVIFLPTGHEFPVPLGINQTVYFIVNVPFSNNVAITIKKCDESDLHFAYTFDYQEFVQQIFTNEQIIPEEQLITDIVVKTNKNSNAIYLKVQGSEDSSSLFTIVAQSSFVKIKKQKVKAGQKGQLNYHFTDGITAQVSFAPLVCPASSPNCQKDFTFSSLVADKMQKVYAQLVCSSIAFDLQDRTHVAEVKTSPVHAALGGRIIFNQTIDKDIQYIGVKGVNNKTGQIVYYRPVQIVTLWGQVQKNGKSGGILMILILVVSICSCMICYRRTKRPTGSVAGYAPLGNMD